MNAQQLKNSILQEAIEGRLVPQDPNDEPASALLDKIRAETKRLVKEGKLKKKDLEETSISENEIPFKIPKSWLWVRLKDIIIGTGAGKSPNCEKRPKFGNEWGVITTTAIQYCAFLPDENKVLPSTFVVNEQQILRDKDLLITRAGPKNRTGIVCVVDKPCNNLILSDKTVRIDYIRGYCNPFYLMYALNNSAIHDNIMSATVGMAESQVNISQSSIQSIIIPLPPLAEQKSIVEKIEELLPKVEEYGKAQDSLDKLNEELLERLKKSILQEAIKGRLVPQDPNDEPASVLLDKIRKEKAKLVKEGKLKKKDLEEIPISEDEIPFEIPDSWEWVRINQIATSQLGKTLDKGKQSGKEYPYLCSINVYWDGINLDNVKTFLLQEEELSRYKLQKGDLLVCEGGDYGRCAVWDRCDEMYYQNALHRIRFFGNLSEYFYKYVFEQYRKTDYIVGQGQTIKHFTYANMSSLLFPLPPLAEQHRIVEKIEQLMNEIDKLKL